MFNSAQFRKDILKYAGINFDTGDVRVRNKLTVVSNTSYIGNYTGLPAVSRSDVNGNLIGNTIEVFGNVTANYLFGDGGVITGISNGPLPSVINTDIIGNLTGNTVNASGTVSTGGFFIGNGSNIVGVVTTLPQRANADILRGNITAAGNVDASNITVTRLIATNVIVTGQVYATGNVFGNYFIGNGALLTGVTSTLPRTANMNITGNVASPGNVIAANVSTGVLRVNGNTTVSGQVNVSGNVSGTYLTGNGSLLTGVFTGNLSRDLAGNVTAPGNVTADMFFGNGFFLKLNGSTIQPQGNVVNQAARLALPASIGTIVTQDDINTQFMLTSLPPSANANWLQFSGNNFPVSSLFGRLGDVVLISGTDINSIQGQSMAGSGDITNANLDIVGNIVAPANVTMTRANIATLNTDNLNANIIDASAGNVTGLFFFGNASGITNASYLLPARANMDITGNVVAPANVDATNVSTNVIIVSGNVFASGQVNVIGNVSVSYLFGNGSQLACVVPTFSPVSFVNIVGNVSATGNVNATNVVTARAFVNGNITVLGETNVTGNIRGDYFIGNGVALENVNATVINGQTVNINGNVSAPGNVDAENVVTSLLRVNGNTTVSGQVNVITGNIRGSFFVGRGDLLTGVVATLASGQTMNINGNVSAPANVDAGNVTVNNELRVTGNMIVTGQVVSTANVHANFFIGSGSRLTNVPSAVTASQVINIFGNVSAPANVNATNVTADLLRVNGNLTVAGQVNITGNIVANFFVGEGRQLTNIAASGTQNITVVGNVSAPGNVDAANITANSMIIDGNTIVTGHVNITGNVTAGFFVGDGSRITNIPACTAPTSVCFVQPSTGFTSNTFCLDYAPTNGWSFVLPSNGAPSTIRIQTFSLPLDPSVPFSGLPANVTQTVSTSWALSNGIWTSNVTLTSNGTFGPNTFNMGFSNFFGRYLGNSSNTVISSTPIPNQLGFTNIDNTIPVIIIAEYINPTTGNISLCFQGTGKSFLGRTWANQVIFYALVDKNFNLISWNQITTGDGPYTSNIARSAGTNTGKFVSETELYFVCTNSPQANSSMSRIRFYNDNSIDTSAETVTFPTFVRVNPTAQVSTWTGSFGPATGSGVNSGYLTNNTAKLSLSPDGTKVFTTFQLTTYALGTGVSGNLTYYLNNSTNISGNPFITANIAPVGPTYYHGISCGIWAANGVPISRSLADVYANVNWASAVPMSIQTYSDAWSEDSNTAYYTLGSFEAADIGYQLRTWDGTAPSIWVSRGLLPSTRSNAQFNNLAFNMMRTPFGNLIPTQSWTANAIAIGNAFTPSYFIRPGTIAYSGEGNLWFAAAIYKNTSYTGNSRFTFAGNAITTPAINTSGLGFMGLWKIQDLGNGNYSSLTLLSNSSEIANTSKYMACAVPQSISIGRKTARGVGVMQISSVSNTSNITFATPFGTVACTGLTNPSDTRLTSFDIFPNLFITGFNTVSNVLLANACNGEQILFGNVIDYNYSLQPLLSTHAKLNIDNIP
ncbi:Chlorovirus glycoprotein repeat domain-containing protein [Only Syngen Nebraska virus 5]|uniref:Chlorovirus glycoprotein repeat domain-containing protein n=1 Tax=Only Syngen Nebraska virus 5 TaxID=1917232 RepID=UPI0009008AD9|nr:Chlorovirus glycoprotein repeat domain-containing protein [Only Syngen Nebraska virus 5]APC25598.1 Chlorovirus glycoprotein repeat domain-containing protein [Only Syngen Nebraska virus 5]